MNEKEINKQLDEEDPNKVKAVMKIGPKFFIKLFNKLCGACRMKVINNPKTPMTEYCDKCLKVLNKEWDKKK